MLKVAIYARYSTDMQKDTSIEDQIRLAEKRAAQEGWTVFRHYTDHGISGASIHGRPGIQMLMQDARERKFDIVLSEALDRLSREGALETLQHLNRLTGYGVQWRSLTEQYLDSTGMFKDAVISILAVVARQERVRLAERTRAGLERARREGKILGRPSAKVDADAVREMRRDGVSWSEISRRTGVARATCQKVIA